MAIVAPVIENTVRLQPLARERLQAADFGGDIVPNAVARLGSQVQQQATQLGEEYDTAAVKRAAVSAMQDTLAIKQDITARQGLDAAGGLTEAQQRLQKVRELHIGKLANRRQQAAFADYFDRTSLGDIEAIGGHENEQVNVAHRNEAKAFGDMNYSAALAEAPKNYERANTLLKTATAQLRIVSPGQSAAFYANADAKLRSGFHREVADGMAARGSEGVVQAEQWVKDHAADMLPDDQTAFYKAYQPQLDQVDEDTAFGMVIGGASADSRDPSAPPAAVRSRNAQSYAQPPGTGKPSSTFNSAREGGRRHSAVDYPMPRGAPIRPVIDGVVVAKGFEQKGGYFVRVRHADGRFTSYADMRAPSPVDVGQEVSRDTVVGAAGYTGGNSSGSHLHFSVFGKDGKTRLDPQKQTWSSVEHPAPVAQGSGDTAGLPTYRPERLDEAALMKRAHDLAQAEHWSPSKYDRIIRRIQGHVNVADSLRERQFSDAAEKADETIASLGDGYTSINQIPNYSSLSPAAKRTYSEMARRNREGDNVSPYGDRYNDLADAATNPARRQDFLSMSRDELRRGVSKGEGQALINRQREMRFAKPDAPAELDIGEVYSQVRQIAPTVGIKAGDSAAAQTQGNIAKMTQLRDAAIQAVQSRQAASGKKLGALEIQGIVRSLAQQTYAVDPTTGVREATPKPLYLQPRGGRVQVPTPRWFIDGLNGARKARNLPSVSDAQAREEYIRQGYPVR